MAELNEKQKRFCEEYMIDLNATQAAIRAGYSAASAEEIGSRLLRNVKVRAYVDKLLAQQSVRTGITADRVLRELAKVAFLKADDLIDVERGVVKEKAASEDLSAIASIKVKSTKTKDGGEIEEREVKVADKIKALELLGKYFALFTEKIEAEVKNNAAQEELREYLRTLKSGGG